LIVDASVVIDFFLEEEPVSTEFAKLLIEEESHIILHQLAEICDYSVRAKRPAATLLEYSLKLCKRASIEDDDLVSAAKLKWEQREAGKKRFSLADALLLSVGRRLGETVVTKDAEFIGIEGVTVLGHS
jgi:predicted nucleic acid-binding protein